MPHIIVEYPVDFLAKLQVEELLKTIHNTVSDSGLFDASHIKTRACPFLDYTNAGKADPYIHIQARIKSGRDADNKKRLSNAIINGIAKLNLKASVITVEVIDMDRGSYTKLTH